ncbi:MAG: hypothetical protein ACETWM_02065, partial [Candidatus Lokiarchaeia archaeon]
KMKYKMLEGTNWTTCGEFIKIDEVCTGCRDCIEICPSGVVRLVNGKAKAKVRKLLRMLSMLVRVHHWGYKVLLA